MKKTALFAVGLLLIVVFVFFPPSNKAWLDRMFASVVQGKVENQPKKKNPSDLSKDSNVKSTQVIKLSSQQVSGQTYIKLAELANPFGMQLQVDEKNGTCQIMFGNSVYQFVRDIAVMNKNGIYQPMKAPMEFSEQSKVLLPISTIKKILGSRLIDINKQKDTIEVMQQKLPSEKPHSVPKMNKQELIKYLSFLDLPIKGAHVSTQNSSLPGAPRTYRKGVHEGIDWYGGATTGVPVNRNTPVHSIADGVVVRVDHNFKEWTPSERKKWLAEGIKNNGQTPAYILDKLRGRSVWVQHKNGVMARYVHLDQIPKSLQVGQKVKSGDVLGFVGNSGTSDGAKGNDKGLHLHLDLFIYGDWFWKNYTPRERRQILEEVFDPNEKE